MDEFDDLDDDPRPSSGRGKAARNDDYEDYDDEPRRPAKKRSRDDDEDDYDDAPRRPAARKGRDDDYDDYDDEDDRPRGKKGKGGSVGGSTTAEERNNAFLFYVFLLVGGFIQIGPLGGLIWWFIKRGESKFVDHVGKQYLNHAITIVLVLLAASIVLGGLAVVGFIAEVSVIGFIGIGLLVLVMVGIGLMEMVLFFMAMFKVKAGEWYRYPLTMQLFK